MKRFLSVFLILAIFCSFVIPANAASPAVSVSSSKTAVNPGDTVTITVKLAAGSNLNGIKFKVEYNTTEFQYITDSVESSNIFMVEPNDRNKGSIIYSGVSMSTVTTGGTLMSFKLKVLEYGGKISITVIEALDENDNETKVSATGTTLKCAHGNAEWKVTKKATCTAKGVETGTCPCGNVSTRDIPMNEHTVGKYTVTKESTCTEKGTKKAVCTTCNKEFTEEIKATGHTYGKWIVEKEATETETGLEKSECTVCGEIKEQIIPVINSETEASTENTTESTTFKEENSEEPSTQASSGNLEEENPSTAKTVVLTILTTLSAEAIIAGIIVLILKKRKKEQ